MSKHTHFTGQPVLAQIINLIPRSLVSRLARRHRADHYCKRFYSWDHLITMLYAAFSGCGSLREVTTGMLAAEGKLRHLGLSHTPRRSTLSDANMRRPAAFFGELYHELARLVRFRDAASGKEFTFLTNLFSLAASQIAALYRQRWQIELVFKRIKGAWPLRYFLGDSPNAIKIQIWCALIADLLLGLLARQHRRRWSYANLRAMIRLHCFSYVELGAFLKNPLKALLQQNQQRSTLSLFPP